MMDGGFCHIQPLRLHIPGCWAYSSFLPLFFFAAVNGVLLLRVGVGAGFEPRKLPEIISPHLSV